LFDLPKGNFNASKQTWEFEGKMITNHYDFAVYMGTGSSTTYSATSNFGKDNDTDDQGT
jgi:hypothetical protein